MPPAGPVPGAARARRRPPPRRPGGAGRTGPCPDDGEKVGSGVPWEIGAAWRTFEGPAGLRANKTFDGFEWTRGDHRYAAYAWITARSAWAHASGIWFHPTARSPAQYRPGMGAP